MLYDGCNALDVIGFRESVTGIEGANFTFVSLDGCPIQSNLGFIRFRADTDMRQPGSHQLMVIPGSDKKLQVALTTPALVNWLHQSAASASVLASIGNGALLVEHVLQKGGYSQTPRTVNELSGAGLARWMDSEIYRFGSQVNEHTLKNIDFTWDRMHSFLIKNRPAYLC
jgi:hypothetical protein